jgi:hypothetical protein
MLHPLVTIVCATLLASQVGGAVAQPALSAKNFQALGGEYSQQCADPGSLRADVGRQSLTLRYRGKSVTAHGIVESTSHLGRNPPKDFSIALVSSVPDTGKLAFIAFTTPQGTELAVDADPKVLEAVGLLRLSALRFRKCG